MSSPGRWFLLLAVVTGCGPDVGLLLAPRISESVDLDGFTLVARIVHVTDTHIVDEESPARFAGAQVFTSSAWRPYESYSTQLLDGIIRTANRIHASGRSIDFLIHTGDACDNVQSNELGWFLAVVGGGLVDPRSGPDDRPIETHPEPAMDPHAVFEAQGLYRTGRYGDLASIPWYIVPGNHDVHSIGVFPIFDSLSGHRVAPLPAHLRPGALVPAFLNPVGSWSHGNVTPANPGPPELLEWPSYVEPNPERAFFSKREFVRALFDTGGEPAGHGFSDPEAGLTWYSVHPVPGLRLIGLDTTDGADYVPGVPYPEGIISAAQLAFLRGELDAALARSEIVVVATHHPSVSLRWIGGSAVGGAEFRDLLNAYPNVVLHLCGHLHRNRVTDQGGYIEIETCSTLDLPQEGRLIEIWQDPTTATVIVTYEMFSHLNDELPPLGDDPLRGLREAARAIAMADKDAAARQKVFDPSGADPFGNPSDRNGLLVLPSAAAD